MTVAFVPVLGGGIGVPVDIGNALHHCNVLGVSLGELVVWRKWNNDLTIPFRRRLELHT